MGLYFRGRAIPILIMIIHDSQDSLTIRKNWVFSRKTRQSALLWDGLIIRNWYYPSPSKSDSPGCRTVTNQELVQPHKVDISFCREFMWLLLLRLLRFSSAGGSGVGLYTIFSEP
jgi:hypothetical protein